MLLYRPLCPAGRSAVAMKAARAQPCDATRLAAPHHLGLGRLGRQRTSRPDAWALCHVGGLCVQCGVLEAQHAAQAPHAAVGCGSRGTARHEQQQARRFSEARELLGQRKGHAHAI